MFDPVREIVYVYMRGQGWIPTIERVPSPRQAAKPTNFGWVAAAPITASTNDDWFVTRSLWRLYR